MQSRTWAIFIALFLLLFIFTFCLRDQVAPSWYVTFLPLWLFSLFWAMSFFSLANHVTSFNRKTDLYKPLWGYIVVEIIAWLGFSTSAVFIACKLEGTISWVNWLVLTPVMVSLVVILLYCIYTYVPKHKISNVVPVQKTETEQESSETENTATKYKKWDEIFPSNE